MTKRPGAFTLSKVSPAIYAAMPLESSSPEARAHGYIFSLIPCRISHQLTGYVVAKPAIIAICMLNQ